VNHRALHREGLTFSALEQGEGSVVLCLHGFPDHARSFRHQLPALAGAGFHAIAPMMRGYEPSSQPADGDYHVVRMAEDVVAWIDELGAERVHLVGHDWGAVIAYLVAAMAPERVRSLTTMAIPHPGRMERELLRKRPSQLGKSWYMFFFQLRGFADLWIERDDWAFIEMLWRDWSPGWTLPDDELRAVKATLSQPGVKRAALGYYRAIFEVFSPEARETRQLFARKIDVPTLALTGALDACMDTRLHDDVMSDADFPAGLRVVRLEGAGHFLHQEKPGETNRLLREWLTTH
jgi:pimeloyl-ACP methyl ester carboxylesterase